MGVNRFIHSGSSLLNLALTGNEDNGWPLGRVSNIVGDKSTGKTLFALEACRMLLDFPPEGLTPHVYYFELESAFDADYARSLGMPVDHENFTINRRQKKKDDHAPIYLEELYATVKDICKEATGNEAVLIALDSLDALDTEKEASQDMSQGSYGMDKQKKLSSFFKGTVGAMERANVHFMVISQVRENITTLPFAPKYRRSGGRALDFYASHTIWLAEIKRLANAATKRPYGIVVKAKITKNKVAPPLREVEFPVIYGYGVDDVSSVMDYLLENKDICKDLKLEDSAPVKNSAGRIVFEESNYTRADFVKFLEDNPSVFRKMQGYAGHVWRRVEEHTLVVRKPKRSFYGEVKNDDLAGEG